MSPSFFYRLSRVLRFRGLPVLIAISLLALFSSAGPTITHAQSEEERLVQATDLYQMREIRDVVLSPSGRFVAYTVRQAAPGSDGSPRAHETQLYVRTSRGANGRLLTRTQEGASEPAWHPDGSRLAFVRPVNGTPQIFIMSMSGGEPYQLTDAPHGAHAPNWSPSGDELLFASHVPQSYVRRHTNRPPPSERPGRTAGDLTRTPPPDTVLILRHANTLDAVDTLDVRPSGALQLWRDTTRTLRVPRATARTDSLAGLLADSLNAFDAPRVRALLDTLGLHPDTTALTVVPDTAASPNGNRVQVRRWLNQNRNRTATVSSRLNVGGGPSLTPKPKYRHHFLVDVPPQIRTRTPRRPTARSVTSGYRSFGSAEWLPGGNQIVASATPATNRHPDRVQKRNLYVVDVNRDRVRRLLEIRNHILTAPTLTEDGSMVAFRVRPLDDRTDPSTAVGLFSLDGRSEPRIITSTLDRHIDQIRWSPEGWYLYATASSRGGKPIYRFSPFSPDTTAAPSMSVDQAVSRDTFTVDSTMVRAAPYRQMTDAGRSVYDFDVTDATAVYAATSATTPSALYTNTVSFANERRISNQNAGWTERRRISTPRRITAESDSLRIDGWVTRPPTPTDSSTHPFVVLVRGGPVQQPALHTPAAWFERQYLSSRGIGVVEVLPRGSAGYDRTFRRANDGNWSVGPAHDVLAVADSAATLAWTDSTQQAIGGASYGASVAVWLLAQTSRFEAAVARNGAYDLAAVADGGEAWPLIAQEFGGLPWETPPSLDSDPPLFSAGTLFDFEQDASVRQILTRNSAAAFAAHINTPTLLIEGDSDDQTGAAQSRRLYQRLKLLERPVEYVEYRGVGHDVSTTATARQRVDRLVRTYEFLTRYLSVPPSSHPPSDDASAQP